MNPTIHPSGDKMSCTSGNPVEPLPPLLDPKKPGPCEMELLNCTIWAERRPTDYDPFKRDLKRCLDAYKECKDGLIPDWPHKPMPTY